MDLKTIIKKYKHAWVALYAFIYVPWFLYLEKHVTTNFHVIYSPIDDHIPFLEYFIVPYLLWFLFIGATILYFFFTDAKQFYKLMTMLCIGMTLFLVISTIYPNGLNLRPTEFVRDNLFVDLVKKLYHTDTSTNVLPSLHVYNSLCAQIAIMKCPALQKRIWIQNSTLVLTILIVMATVFLKQHSIIDVIAAFIMAGGLYAIVYGMAKEKSPELQIKLGRSKA